MLQQTRVETVIDYFNRWLRSSPLSKRWRPDQQEVLKAGKIGYYAGAQHRLHRSLKFTTGYCQKILALLKLTGIGVYTVGAILSLAFGKTEPILDGNVKRVLAVWRISTRRLTTVPRSSAVATCAPTG